MDSDTDAFWKGYYNPSCATERWREKKHPEQSFILTAFSCNVSLIKKITIEISP